jgi:hypothetical protein
MTRPIVYTPVESYDETSILSSTLTPTTTSTGGNLGEITSDATSWEEDHRPLLPRSSRTSSLYRQEGDASNPHHLVPTATPFSCAINLANTILGTGMLAMVRFLGLFSVGDRLFMIKGSRLSTRFNWIL